MYETFRDRGQSPQINAEDVSPLLKGDKSHSDGENFIPKRISMALGAGFLILFCTLAISAVSYKNLRVSQQVSVTESVMISEATSTQSSLKAVSASASQVKPNFIFVLADDLGYNSIGYEEHDLTSVTPYLTSLAKDGIVLTNYYAQEVCTPSRASLLTGRYPISLGMQYDEVLSDGMWGLNISETLLPEVLRDTNSYKNYAIGKWNLGHYTPLMLPTARGFDQFIGFMNGENYYWSKRYPLKSEFTDFAYADTDCHTSYEMSDMQTYSTFLYRDKAIQAIGEHNFDLHPMFLYLSAQAVHDPFNDIEGSYNAGIPKDYLNEEVYEYIQKNVIGASRQQYAMALNLLDGSIKAIVEAMVAKGQMDNTYLIFASDNGGCYSAGGRNGDLRGSKGSLFEGGVKVDSFIYSPSLLPDATRGSKYSNIMHVSDWFPTILDLAGIKDYSPAASRSLDGVSHASAMLATTAEHQKTTTSSPREYLLYNMYYLVESQEFDFNSNAAVAIRDSRYKLIHSFSNNPQTTWYSYDMKLAEEDDESFWSASSCPQYSAMTGDFEKFLFDLQEDPNEKENLFANPEYEEIKKNLYAELEKLKAKAVVDTAKASAADYSSSSSKAMSEWKKAGNFILPWDTASYVSSDGHAAYLLSGEAEEVVASVETIERTKKSFPTHCIPQHSLFD